MLKVRQVVAIVFVLSALLVHPVSAQGSGGVFLWIEVAGDYMAAVGCTYHSDGQVSAFAGIHYDSAVSASVAMPGSQVAEEVSGRIERFVMGEGLVSAQATIVHNGTTIYSNSWTCGETQEVASASHFIDGRVNSYAFAAPIAVYGASAPSIWGIDAGGEGIKIMEVTAEEIAAIGVPAGASVVIAEAVNPITGAMVTLYRLSTSELQVNTIDGTGNPYVYTWELPA